MIDLKKMAAVIEEAAIALKEDPDLEVSTIVNEVMGHLGAGHGDGGNDLRKKAEERLAMAVQRNDELEDWPGAASVDAMAGIGYALLSVGLDAEVFFSMFAPDGGAEITLNGQVTPYGDNL